MVDAHLERIRAHFGRTAETYARLMRSTQEAGLVGLVRLSRASAQERVLDVACGPGFLTLAFATVVTEAIGFDATDEFLALAATEAERRGLTNVAFEHGDAEQLPYDDGSFDLVVCRAAFHHMPRPEQILSEMVRVTNPRGRILIADLLGSEDPNKAALHDGIERRCDPTHVRALPASELQALFRAAQLTVAREVYGTMDYDLEQWISSGEAEPAARAEIISLMESCLKHDHADLRVRRENGRLCFSHRTAAFLLSPPGESV